MTREGRRFHRSGDLCYTPVVSTILTQEQLAHIAALARLQLTDSELSTFEHQFAEILGAFEGLQKVDTTGVVELHQVTGLTSVLPGSKTSGSIPPTVLRADEVRSVASRAQMLASARHPLVADQIKVPSPHGLDA